MSIEERSNGHLHRTDAFAALDPTEKGMVSYFLGMTLCKLFANRFLQTPWLLHLDVFRDQINPATIGRSRPDLVGQSNSWDWHAFESKGRATIPSHQDKAKAKDQALRLVSVNGQKCNLHVGSIVYFKSNQVNFYWLDPEPTKQESIELPPPNQAWRFYFEPALSLASDLDSETLIAERALTDVQVEVHPKINRLLQSEQWEQAKAMAVELQDLLRAEGYGPDGIRVRAGESWRQPFETRG